MVVAPGCASRSRAPLPKIAVDERWQPFAPYYERMIAQVQSHWEKRVRDGNTYPKATGSVTVKFVLGANGLVKRIVDVQERSTDAAMRACVAAITQGAPYGGWSPEMRAALGEESEMTLAFFFE